MIKVLHIGVVVRGLTLEARIEARTLVEVPGESKEDVLTMMVCNFLAF